MGEGAADCADSENSTDLVARRERPPIFEIQSVESAVPSLVICAICGFIRNGAAAVKIALARVFAVVAYRVMSAVFPYLIYLPVLVAVAMHLAGVHGMSLFVASCIAMVPMASLMGRATESLAARTGAAMGGFLNATFGNAAELILAIFALRSGLVPLVQATLTGSIVGNLLLVLGVSMFVGGWKRSVQTFSSIAAESGSSLLVLSVIGILIPSAVHMTDPGLLRSKEIHLTLWVSVVLMATYFASLLFSLKTHRHLFGSEEETSHHKAEWGPGTAIVILAVAAGVVSYLSENIVHTVGEAGKALGFSDLFMGAVLLAMVGNAAEHASAVLMARKNKMDVTLNICLGSSLQIALFVGPLLVIIGYAIGQPLPLAFTSLEIVAIAVSTLAVPFVILNGQSNWFEGIELLSVYTILGLAFYYF